MNLWGVRQKLFGPLLLATCAAALLVWATGFFYAEVKVWPKTRGGFIFTLGTSGRGLCVRHTMRWPIERWHQEAWLGMDTRWVNEWWPRAQHSPTEDLYFVPWWNIAAGSILVLTGVHLLHSRQHCRKCGYDLRGLPGNICPECGRSFRG